MWVTVRLPVRIATAALVAITVTAVGPTGASPQEAPRTIPEVVQAMYAGMSGGAGEERDWDAWRALYLPGALLVPTRTTDDGVLANPSTVDEWITASGAGLVERGFFEWETGRETHMIGNTAIVMSAYAYGSSRQGEARGHGVNSFHLVQTAEGWRIASLAWTAGAELDDQE